MFIFWVSIFKIAPTMFLSVFSTKLIPSILKCMFDKEKIAFLKQK